MIVKDFPKDGVLEVASYVNKLLACLDFHSKLILLPRNPSNLFSLPVFHGKKIYKAWVISAPA